MEKISKWIHKSNNIRDNLKYKWIETSTKRKRLLRLDFKKMQAHGTSERHTLDSNTNTNRKKND